MNLHQFKFIHEAALCNFNLSLVAKRLYISQPAVSKAITQIEDELGVTIFVRHAKRLNGFTPIGQALYAHVQACLFNIQEIKTLAQQQRIPNEGTLNIATTHTQARYVLPEIIQQFRLMFPLVKLKLTQGAPQQMLHLLKQDQVDVVIASEIPNAVDHEVYDAFSWQHVLVTPKNHVLALNVPALEKSAPLTLAQLVEHPLITYDCAFAGRKAIDLAFEQAHLSTRLNIILEAMDSDIIKTYVALGLGIGIMAEIAFDVQQDHTLQTQTLGHLFGTHTVKAALKKNKHQRSYTHYFIEQLQTLRQA